MVAFSHRESIAFLFILIYYFPMGLVSGFLKKGLGSSYSMILLFLVLLYPSPMYPLDPLKKVHTYPVSSWDVEDGLPQSSVMAILQTRNKYLWMGTERGLVRFDGVNFITLHSTENKNIRNNRVTALLASRDGSLYSGSRGGGLIRIRDGDIEGFRKKDGLGDNFILSLLEDSRGTIWIGTFKGLSKMEPGGQPEIFDPGEKLKDKVIISLQETPDGRIWAGTYKNGIFSISGNRVNEYSLNGTSSGVPVRIFLVDRSGTLWAGTNGAGLAVYKEDQFIPFEKNALLSSPNVFSLYQDSSENIWVGTTAGLNRISGGSVSKWPEESILSEAVIRALYEDHEGSLWAGTNDHGLIRLSDTRFNSLSVLDGLSADTITCIFEDSAGCLWIGTDGKGLNRLSSIHDDTVQVFSTRQGLTSDFIYSITEDINGEIWIGTASGITIVHRTNQQVITRIQGKQALPNDVINVLYTSPEGVVWGGTSGGGLIRFSPGGNKIYSTENGLSNNFVHSLCEDKNKALWIGTYGGGIDRLKDGEFSNFNSDSGLSNDFVFAIAEDRDNNIWLGTGGGLNLIRKGKIFPIRNRSPIFSDTIYNILISDSSDLWLTSNLGLFKLGEDKVRRIIAGSSEDLHLKLFNSRDGLNSDECRGGIQPAGWKTLSGTLLIPTTKGVSILEPEKEFRQIPPPPVYINKIEGDYPFTMENGEAVFHGKTKKIDFSFTALSFIAPERIRFKVKLDGFDKEWSEIRDPRNRSVSYTNLSAGEYNFRVVASNSDGIWNTSGVNFKFRIRSLFYNSPFFIILSGLALVSIFVYLYIMRIRMVRRRESELKLQVDERTKELRSSNIRLTEANEQKSELLSMAAHDLKNPLQAIIGFSELISLREDCPENIKKNAHLILEASRGMLDTINNTLNSTVILEGKVTISNEEDIDLSELARLVVEIYSEFAKKKNQIVITRFWSDCFIRGEKERIKIVIENLLSNAIKYSPLNRNIILSVERLGKNVVLSVKDEGSGFSEEDKKKMYEKFKRLSSKPTAGESSTGIGLSIVKNIVEMHRGKIWLESKEGEGSIFFVSFPAIDSVDTWKVK